MRCRYCAWLDDHAPLCPTDDVMRKAWYAGSVSILKEPSEPTFAAVADGSAWHTAWMMGYNSAHT